MRRWKRSAGSPVRRRRRLCSTVAQKAPDDALRELAWSAWLRHPEHRTGALSPSETKRTMGPLVKSVLRALGQKNMDALARLAHPQRGLRFGLCGQFIPSGVFPSQVRGLLRDDAPKSWGGSCTTEDRELSFDDYLDHLTGFEDAPIVGYDVWLAATAKDQEQLPVAEVERTFPDGAFVELALAGGTRRADALRSAGLGLFVLGRSTQAGRYPPVASRGAGATRTRPVAPAEHQARLVTGWSRAGARSWYGVWAIRLRRARRDE